MKFVYSPDQLPYKDLQNSLSSVDGPPQKPNLRHIVLENPLAEFVKYDGNLPNENFYYVLDVYNVTGFDAVEENFNLPSLDYLNDNPIPVSVIQRVQQSSAKILLSCPFHGTSEYAAELIIEKINRIHGVNLKNSDYVLIMPTSGSSKLLQFIDHTIFEWSTGKFLQCPAPGIKPRSRKFTSLNRLYTHARFNIVLSLLEHHNEGILSMLQPPDRQQEEQFKQLYPELWAKYHQSRHFFPLVWDQPWSPQLNGRLVITQEEHVKRAMQDVYLCIETETKLLSNRYPVPQWHCEKIYKPMAFGQAFILVCQQGSLAALRRQGYQTFHPYIDESYDLIEDEELRIAAALDQARCIISMNDDEIYQWYLDILPILQHNHQHLQNRAAGQQQRIWQELERYLVN